MMGELLWEDYWSLKMSMAMNGDGYVQVTFDSILSMKQEAKSRTGCEIVKVRLKALINLLKIGSYYSSKWKMKLFKGCITNSGSQHNSRCFQ